MKHWETYSLLRYIAESNILTVFIKKLGLKNAAEFNLLKKRQKVFLNQRYAV